MGNIVVGKHTLESLTSGMYSDPFVVYREYIQNSTDAIDEAYRKGILKPGEDRIDVEISPSEKRISICDNGIGVPHDFAEKTLISIGNSKKTSTNSRGFRGIGRLAALSYCKKLTFETSTSGEKYGTRITIDSDILASLLSSTSGDDITVTDVLSQVYTVTQYTERESKHYFRVIMDAVDESSGLTKISDVIEYISQNAPVPYNLSEFPWGQEITQRLKKEGYVVHEYNINLIIGTEHHPLYKPYKSEFLVDKGRQITDRIEDIEIVKFTAPDQSLLAIGWLAKTHYLGSIYDKTVKGIRLRKGNILIGDQQTLNSLFKDPRFNGWSVGEIFAVSPHLVPNARRDNFEKNEAFFTLVEKMNPFITQIARDIRNASMARNRELSRVLEETAQATGEAAEALTSGIRGSRKHILRQSLTEAQKALAKVNTEGTTDAYFQEIAFDELDMLIGKVKGATAYKAINTIDSLSNTEKQILERVFNILIAESPEKASSIIDIILRGFTSSK